MLRSAKVATPFTAVTVLVPDSVPGTSMPPLCPMAIVTGPLKPVTALPDASVTVTCTAGVIVIIGRVVFGWTAYTKCGGGLSARVVASQECGEVKYQFQRGSAEPPLGKTAYCASALMAASPTSVMLVNVGGGSVPTTVSAIVTP